MDATPSPNSGDPAGEGGRTRTLDRMVPGCAGDGGDGGNGGDGAEAPDLSSIYHSSAEGHQAALQLLRLRQARSARSGLNNARDGDSTRLRSEEAPNLAPRDPGVSDVIGDWPGFFETSEGSTDLHGLPDAAEPAHAATYWGQFAPPHQHAAPPPPPPGMWGAPAGHGMLGPSAPLPGRGPPGDIPGGVSGYASGVPLEAWTTDTAASGTAASGGSPPPRGVLGRYDPSGGWVPWTNHRFASPGPGFAPDSALYGATDAESVVQSSHTCSVASGSGSRARSPPPGAETQPSTKDAPRSGEAGSPRREAFAALWALVPSMDRDVLVSRLATKLLAATHTLMERRQRRLKASSPTAREDARMEAGPCPAFLRSRASIAHTYNADGRLGVYDDTGRAFRLAMYLYKRSRRRWSKGARYTSRKQVAERRPRVRGRFVRAGQAAGPGGS